MAPHAQKHEPNQQHNVIIAVQVSNEKAFVRFKCAQFNDSRATCANEGHPLWPDRIVEIYVCLMKFDEYEPGKCSGKIWGLYRLLDVGKSTN